MATQTATVNIFRLPENANRWTHAAQIKYTDVNDSDFTNDGDNVDVTFTGPDLPTEFGVLRNSIYVKTAFAGSGAVTVESGTDGDPNNFITSTSVTTAGPVITSAGAVPNTLAGSFGSAGDNLMVRLTTEAASGAPADITAGDLYVYWEIVDFDEISRGYKVPS